MADQDWTGVEGKRVVITGATAGIGLAAATELARRHAELTIVARSWQRAHDAAARIAHESSWRHEPDIVLADLSSQQEVRRLAVELLERHPRIDVLANNAGAVNTRRVTTEDGIELTWAVNHLAPFLLTTLLLDRLTASAPARVITTTSDAHAGARIPFDDLESGNDTAKGFRRYGQTKLANILFTSELARRTEGTGVTANCYHPGFVASNFNRNNGMRMRIAMTLARPFARSNERGADTLVWLADSPAVNGQSGWYFVDRRLGKPSAGALDHLAAERLWTLSERQVDGTAPAGDGG
ncbi:MAG TPA: SDR family NAD(P)-dependent oxidoreductase [Actinomycetota bacterium]|jgi:NAD(P)-dependent dehydrogenase (short-subunit alcohol dehydrogenase family)